MTPQFVEVKRCGGGCHTASHSCVSTQRQTRQVAVLLSSCGLTAGLCSKSCATLAIEEDTACRCDCLQSRRTVTMLGTASTVRIAGVSAGRRRSTPCAGTRAGSGTWRSVFVGVQWRWSSHAQQVGSAGQKDKRPEMRSRMQNELYLGMLHYYYLSNEH